MAKSLYVAYVLWFFGGFYGLHHFYLQRDRQALVWWMFVGGYFGLGWLRDLWRLPEYVKDANEETGYMEKLAKKMKKDDKPSSSFVRYCGQLIVSDAFGYLVLAAIPSEHVPDWSHPLLAVFVPLAVAIGIHLVGNIGREQGSFWWPLLGAYLTYPLYFWSLNSVFWTSLFSQCFFNWYSKKWRRKPLPRRHICKRLLVLTFCGALYISLWGSWLYFNCTVTDQSGDEIKCRDAAKNFFTSPMWQEFKSVMKDIYVFAQYNGWKEIWHQLIQAFDPQGEVNALKVLNLDSSATQEEITAHYRKLSRQWHPDRHKDPGKKQVAQEKFIEIQRAYEVLSQIKSKRLTRNKKERDNPEAA
ncbi:dnaJ homolog subfamily C member 22-like [Limulus polyphemus]|uniref:DnaJ homolog subfamily C member 22 n=1 Tax=Limulus polyphemus TaxID=6850 RepID=A0ABM1BID9_LIMPO|nr:dnaJ homolog subfamily C member 22-like [Limulus polyphemus]